MAILAAAVVGAACGGGDGGGGTTEPPPPPPPPGTLAIAVSPAAATVETGESTTASLTVTRGGSFSGAVTLAVAGAPAGVTATPASTSLAAGTTSTTLAVAVAEGTAAGTYPLTVQATGSGVSAASATYTLTVTDTPDPDFSITLADSTVTVEQGDSLAVPVTIRRVGGFTGEVGLSVSGEPSQVRALVRPPSTTDTTVTINITVGVDVPADTYPLVLTAVDNGPRTRTLDFDLVVTPKPSAGGLTLSPTSITVTQTEPSAPVLVVLNRPDGVTGPATLSLEAFSNGMTGTFTPNPMSGDTAQLVINTTLQSGVGTITGRVRADIGNATTTADLLITTRAFVPPDFAVSVTPEAGTVTAGNTATATVGIDRVNFPGAVSFTVTGAPAGATATVTPSPTTADSATLTITTAAGTAAGVYPLVVSGTADGITGPRSADYTLTVNAPGSGGNVQWRFCGAARTPLWFGTRSGASGAWTRVDGTTSGADVTFSFPFAQAGQVAYVLPGGAGGFDVTVHNATPAELPPLAAAECRDNAPATRSLNGTAVNLINSLRGVSVVAGGAFTIVPNNGSAFALTGVREGPIDALAYMGVLTDSGFTQFDRIILRRDLDPADGATLAPFDFGNAADPEWLFASSGNQTFENFGSDAFTIARSYITSNGNTGPYQIDPPASRSPRGTYAVPSGLRRAGDLHQLIAATVNPTAPRSIIAYETGLSSPAIAFGPLLDQPTVSVLGNAPVRIRATAAWQTAYRLSATATFTQGVGATSRSVAVIGSFDFFGGAADYTLEVPDFSGAPGWNPTWTLQSGLPTDYTVSATGLGRGASPVPADDVVIVTGTRVGTVTP